MPKAEMHLIPLARIQFSDTNQRITIDDDAFVELTMSIKAHGVLSPVLVRPLGGEYYELVAGHRRVNAARVAGMLDIPAQVRAMTDTEALELQVVENLQRVNLHPLEEAEGYLALERDHGHTVASIALKVGKSVSYVHGRMQLAKLPPAAKEVFRAGEVTAPLALLIARIPDEALQEKAAKAILSGRTAYVKGKVVDVPLTYGEASELVQRKFMLALKTAPFDTKNETLIPDRGSCTACALRTGNAVDLFGDVKDHDLCTDPPCFERKRAAEWARESAAARAKGVTVLTLAQSEKAFNRHDPTRLSDGWVKPGQKIEGDKKGRTYQQVVKERMFANPPALYAARHPIAGKAVLVWKRADFDALLAAKAKPGSKATGTSAQQAPTMSWEDQQKARDLVREELGMQIRKAAALMDEPTWLRTLCVACGNPDELGGVLEELGHGKDIPEPKALKLLSKLSATELRAVLTELLCGFVTDPIAEAFGLDFQATYKAATQTLKDQAAAAAAAKVEKPEKPEKAKKRGAK